MNTYKITNNTNLLGKRGFKANSELEISYIDNMMKKTIKIKPADSVYLTVHTLPMSVHKLRIKGLVSVTEVGSVELANAIDAKNPKAPIKPVAVEDKEPVVETKKPTKKKMDKE